jgi:hypothetical protein
MVEEEMAAGEMLRRNTCSHRMLVTVEGSGDTCWLVNKSWHTTS